MPTNPILQPACPVCSATPANVPSTHPITGAPTYNQSSYHRCQRCHTIFLYPLPTHEENLAFEGNENADALAAADDARLNLLRRRTALLGTPSPHANALLDIGCSTGRLMGLAHAAGWQVTGIEMSTALAKEAQRHVPSAQIITGDVMLLDTTQLPPFDAIISLDVLEHVLDPAAFLQRCHTLLKPSGRLILHTPNSQSLRARLHRANWNMLIPEYHFTLFSPKALYQSLHETGFREIKITTTSGTGHETGLRKGISAAKESLLAKANLGNALLATAQKS